MKKKAARHFAALILGLFFPVLGDSLGESCGPDLSCEKGTTVVSTNTEFWCRMIDKKGNAVPHGLYRAWYSNILAPDPEPGPPMPESGRGELRIAGPGSALLNDSFGQWRKIEGQFDHGKKTGLWVLYYDDGRRYREEPYANGKLEGPCREWHPNGSVSEESFFREGKLDGKDLTYFETGQKASEGQYKNGEKEGLWSSWDIEGKLRKKETYHSGRLLAPSSSSAPDSKR